MSALPTKPFLTKDFSARAGGIDFLGLRYVNLHMVGTYLIPELNNVTRDMGMLFLGAWIPWKFRQLAAQSQFTENNYRQFREKIEMAISLAMLDQSPSTHRFGRVRNRVGARQPCRLPGELAFANGTPEKRKTSNTLYAAAIYGPSLRALHLIESYSVEGTRGGLLKIALAGKNKSTGTIVTAVDKSLRQSPHYDKIASLESATFTEEEVNNLGFHGLNPACYRDSAFGTAKRSFRQKLLPSNPTDAGFPRTLTARLLIATLKQCPGSTSDQLRNAWFTGLFNDGARIHLTDDLEDQRNHWAYFVARQYQRYPLELLLWCFESALYHGSRSIKDAVSHWEQKSNAYEGMFEKTLRDVLNNEAGNLLRDNDLDTSAEWNRSVHEGHEQQEFWKSKQGDDACVEAVRMLAGWYWRMLVRGEDATYKHLMEFGGSSRMGMQWFLDWLQRCQGRSVRQLLTEIFSDLIFAQHLRIALARFDGKAQRLRFLIGDTGIEPSSKVRKSMGKSRKLPWMPDRLDTLIELLCDIDVLESAEGRLFLGSEAGEILPQPGERPDQEASTMTG